MNQSFKISKDDTLNFLQKHIEENYGYENSTVSARAIAGYHDMRESEPDRVEFSVTAKKDLGLGIGLSEITLNLNEKEVSALIKQKLVENGVQVTTVGFETGSGYGYMNENSIEFTGTKVSIRSLEDMRDLGKSPKQLVQNNIF